MPLRQFVITLVLGALAGWLSGLLTKGRGFGFLGNVIVGVFGAFLGQFLFGLIGIHATSLLAHFVFAIAGALIFVYLLNLIKR